MELKGINFLKDELEKKQTRVRLRYDYYDMKKSAARWSEMFPEKYQWMTSVLGWSTNAVDSIADRLGIHGFRKDDLNFQEIFDLNNKDILFDSSMLDALIASCSFIFISEKEGFPSLQVIDGYNATGIVDDTTEFLFEGYAVLERNTDKSVSKEAYFTSEETVFYTHDKGEVIEEHVPNPALYPLLVPIIHRPNATRPFGRSRITRACMSIQQAALRTIARTEVCSEFYSFPQKYVLGLDPDAEFNNQKAAYSKFLRFDANENGDKPTVGSFSQQSMTPYIEELRMQASLFAGETGLTLDDIGFPSENPSSVEAIKAAHNRLLLKAKKAQKCFSVGIRNAGFLACCVRDNQSYQRQAIYNTQVVWEPLFGVDGSSLGAIGDSIQKIEASFPGYITEEKVYDIFGV
ncbi:MAG: phage portal protein [Lachnospiraceae bacterium]|nr:phage portal protein [Lachnospiraceae bacterium]